MDTEETTLIYESKLGAGGDLMLREASAYFAGVGTLHNSLHRLAARLEQEGIAYALLGGLALAEHGYPRMTEDIDVLLTPSGLQLFRDRCVGRGYRPAFNDAQRTFRDTETGVRIEFLTAGEFPGDGLPKPVAFPDPTAAGVSEKNAQTSRDLPRKTNRTQAGVRSQRSPPLARSGRRTGPDSAASVAPWLRR